MMLYDSLGTSRDEHQVPADANSRLSTIASASNRSWAAGAGVEWHPSDHRSDTGRAAGGPAGRRRARQLRNTQPTRATAVADQHVSQTVVCDRRARAPSGARARPDETEPPAGILPLRVCIVLPRGDPFVAVYGPATATCMPTPALSGSGVSPSIRPLLLLPATRQPVVCRTGFPTADRIQASVAMPRRISNGGFAFHVRPWKLLVVATRFWRMSSTLGCQSRR